MQTPQNLKQNSSTAFAITAGRGRLQSLDVFRGATIAAMLVVNNPGDFRAVYSPLHHARWHGWTFADLIFPFFLWIMGVAMTFSFEKRVEYGDDKTTLLWHIIRRALVLFAMGLLLNGIPSLVPLMDFSVLETIRIPGVLQRIAICYLIAAWIALWTDLRGQVIWTFGLMALYWLMVSFIPVPGYGAGNLEPDGNVIFYLDRLLLGKHLLPNDGLGLISTLPAISTTLLGIITGHLLKSPKSTVVKLVWMGGGGALLIVTGLGLDQWLPINKQLWTPSFTIFTVGIALIVFSGCYWLIEVKGYKSWTKPLVIFGMNAIAIFVLSEVLYSAVTNKGIITGGGDWISLRTYLYQTVFAPLGSPVNTSLYFALAWTLMLGLIGYIMYKQRWLFKV